MRAPGKIALIFGCIGLIAAGWFAWRTHESSARMKQRDEALHRYRDQASRGDALAEALLARMYSDGDGVPQDYAQALTLYRKSADQGSRAGEAGLGSMYYYGLSVPVDYAAAFQWYRRAAAQGNPYSEDAVGTMLTDGLGTAQDYVEAFNWFRKAAERHYPKAEYDLGTTYYYGRGAQQNYPEAYRWLRKAADDGNEDAERFLSMPFSTFAKTRLFVLFAFGLYCISGFAPTRYWRITRAHGRTLKASRVIGVFCIFSAAYSWYGYTHYLMRRLGAGINAFTAGRWIMDVGVVLLLVYIMRSGKKMARSAVETTTS